uniref:Uncharacterized protein n=1 Tax=Romanomermis culicivorax TaxID=13658 RepID=A0A915HYP3_ROMCU
MECNRHKVTEQKKNFRSVRLEVTVGRFPQNCTYPFRPEVDFEGEHFKLLTISSVENGNEMASKLSSHKAQSSAKKYKNNLVVSDACDSVLKVDANHQTVACRRISPNVT